ncbi:hypothetical protein BGZ63DRAFT_400691 [Mariannaea sp. PMI_226]|nr:hypothetical protein BGZ63DRAFT_400691 [Mariannaea sp. PMI_226]
MPSIDVAMARSIRGTPFELLRDAVARSIVAGLGRRGVIQDATQKVTDIKTALSSWDNCMSVAWCNCFQCLKCCGDCCGCCDPPGGRKHKHLDDPYAPEANHHDGYRTEPPMNAPSGNSFAPQTQHWHNEPPKYAEFEVRGAKHDEDALPEMPTMEKAEVTATTNKVGLHDDVEMDHLQKSPVQEQQFAMNGAPSAMPQRSPYGQQQGNNSGYFNGHAQGPDSYSPIDHKGYGYHGNQADGYGHDQYAMGGAAGAAAGGPVGRHSPANNYDGYNQHNGYNQPVDHGYEQGHGGYSEHDNANQGYGVRQAPAPSRTPAPELNGYGYGIAPSRSPAPHGGPDDYHHNARKTPAIQDSYGYRSEQSYANNRAYSPAQEAHYGARPAPQRHYPQNDPPRSPLNNNSGFDFNSGASRPNQSPTTETYPGYKPYQI